MAAGTDDQDMAEAFDEEATGGDGDLETSYPYDRDRSVRDETSALGDADVDGDEEARDEDEESDEELADIDVDDDADEDDLDDDDRDTDALDTDDVPDFTPDTDMPQPGDKAAARRGADEAEVISMGDLNEVDSSRRVSDLESDNLSDADLKELG